MKAGYSMKSFTSHTIPAEQAGCTVEDYLKRILQISGRKIQKLTRQKGILINRKPAFLEKKLKPGDILEVLTENDSAYGVSPEDGCLDILYEDSQLFVINKPPNTLVHPTGRTTGGTLANFLAAYLQKHRIVSAIRPLHRLDRDTSGCVIFAKNSHSQHLLESQLKENTLKRTYWALVKGVPAELSQTICAPIGPHPSLPNRRSIIATGEPAITHYRTIAHGDTASLLELTLETGRTHQVRLHLAHIDCPILGDSMYGAKSLWIKRQALHAIAVTFTDHTGKQITVQAPLPLDFKQAAEHAGITCP